MLLDWDPVALAIGPVHIHWYGLMYVLGFAGFWALGIRHARRAHTAVAPEQVSDLLFYGALGAIIGGRLGSALFYHSDHLLTDPWMILRIWEGGMSFHGGLIGVLIAIGLWQRKSNAGWLATVDFCAPMVPVGLFFGRIGNFINGELWGRPTDLPWGVIFPAAGSEPRHPSQLYEAALEGIVLFAVLWWFAPEASGCRSGRGNVRDRLFHRSLRSGIRSLAGCPPWLSRVRLADHGPASLHSFGLGRHSDGLVRAESPVMKPYLDLLQHVLEHGVDKADRTGVGTRSVFGYQNRYDLGEGVPSGNH